MALLRFQTGSSMGTIIPIQEANLTLGRGKSASIRLADEGSSRQHAEIFRVGSLHFIRDLTSRNGTFVNNRRIAEAVLREGDQIRIGETVLLFLEREDSRLVRVLRLQSGSETQDSVRFRDTMAGMPAPIPAAASPSTAKRISARELRRRVARTIAAEPNLKAMLVQIVTDVGQGLGADRADILLIDSMEPEIRFHCAATFDIKEEGEVAVSRTILRQVIERQEAVLSSDAAADHRFRAADSVASHPLRSVICVPVAAGGATPAVLYLCNSHRPEAFEKEDLDLAAEVGLELSVILGALHRFEARERILRAGLEMALASSAAAAPSGAGAVEAARGAQRVAHYSGAIAHALGLSAEDVSRAWVAGMLHASPLARTASASPPAPEVEPILDAINCQDERHDGSGSPGRKLGDEIPLLGRVLSLAKELERLAGAAGAGGGPEMEEALAALRESAGESFDPDVAGACLVAHRNGVLCPAAGGAGLGG